jgi:hypothetical protein
VEALAGLEGHLAIAPPPDTPPVNPDGAPPGGRGGALAEPDAADARLLVVGYRLRLAVAAAARDGDQATTIALIHQGRCCGLDATVLLAVAARPLAPTAAADPRPPSGAAVGGVRWAWARRPHRRAAVVVVEREGRS